jgi:L-arabinose isomerase
MSHTELPLVDAGTDLRSFAKDVRWNQAYYRPARGF